jgi:hypothetical protein
MVRSLIGGFEIVKAIASRSLCHHFLDFDFACYNKTAELRSARKTSVAGRLVALGDLCGPASNEFGDLGSPALF